MLSDEAKIVKINKVLRLQNGPWSYNITSENESWKFKVFDIDLALRRDAIITMLSDIVVIIECGKGGGTVDTGIKSILQGVPLVVINWDRIKHGKEPVLAEGNRQLMEMSIPSNRPDPRWFPEKQDTPVDFLSDQNLFDQHWHAFLNDILDRGVSDSCRSIRFIRLKRKVHTLINTAA